MSKQFFIRTTTIFLTVSVFSFLLVSSSVAHDWWLHKTKSGYDIVMAHLTSNGTESDAYEPERAIQATGYRQNKETMPITIEWKADGSGSYLRPAEEFSALTALVYNKYWMQTTKGWKNDKIQGATGIIKEGQSYKLTKHINKWEDWLAEPLERRFEIVPLQNPTQLKKGEDLQVRLFFMGRKIHKALITQISGTQTLTKVKTEDSFAVTLSKEGFQFINAKIEIPVRDREIIWYAASLTFDTSTLEKKI